MTRISVDINAIKNISSTLENTSKDLTSIFNDINSAMETINSNWHGTMKETANEDTTNATKAINAIKTNLSSAVESFVTLANNAENIEYGNYEEEE